MKTIRETQELRVPHRSPYLTRLRGGTYSPTVDLLHFADGSAALTDLIRLNPNVDGYSLDQDGRSPARLARYEYSVFDDVGNPRARQFELRISRIVAGSYPVVSLAQLSDILRTHRYPLDGVNLREHEAIAATQAAIWHYTNDSHLDTHPSHEWLEIDQTDGDPRLGFRTIPLSGAAACIPMEFEQPIELRRYEIAIRGKHDGVSVWLEKSTDGSHWRKVSTSLIEMSNEDSAAEADANPWYRKNLGHATTLTRTQSSGRPQGHRYYRVVLAASPDGASVLPEVAVTGLRFQPLSAAAERNSDRVIFLHDYLLRRARGDIHADPHLAEQARTGGATPSDWAGPFTVTGAVGSISVSAQGGPVRVCNSEGRTIDALRTHQQFYLAPNGAARGSSTLYLTVENQPVIDIVALTGTDTSSCTESYTPVVSGHVSGSRSELLVHTINWNRESSSMMGEVRTSRGKSVA